MKRQKTKDIIAMSIFIGGILAILGIMLFSGYQDNKDRKEALDMAEKNSHWADEANKKIEQIKLEGDPSFQKSTEGGE